VGQTNNAATMEPVAAIAALEDVRATLAGLVSASGGEPWGEEAGFALGRVEAAIRLARAPRVAAVESAPVRFAWGKRPGRRF